MSTKKPTSLSFSEEELALRDELVRRTGLKSVELFRRYMKAHASGAEIPGVPRIVPPLRTL